MADTTVLEAVAARRAGSSPVSGTISADEFAVGGTGALGLSLERVEDRMQAGLK
jgi:hypothetical protein